MWACCWHDACLCSDVMFLQLVRASVGSVISFAVNPCTTSQAVFEIERTVCDDGVHVAKVFGTPILNDCFPHLMFWFTGVVALALLQH